MANLQKRMIQEYQDVLDVQEFSLLVEDMPFSRIGQRLVNTARLFGREFERNVTNTAGQIQKVSKATVDTVNPFISFPHMKANSKEIDDKIQQKLAAIDERYADAIAALWQSAQLTDFQTFLFMLNPALYLGTKTLPKSINFAVNALATATGQTDNAIVRRVTNATQAANRITSVGGPMANQQASYSGGGYGGYGGDYGGDYGGGDY